MTENLKSPNYNYVATQLKVKVNLSDRACKRCFNKKTKCSMQLPSCLTCTQTKTICDYDRKVSRRYKHRPKSNPTQNENEKQSERQLYSSQTQELKVAKNFILPLNSSPKFELATSLQKNPLLGIINNLISTKFDLENVDGNLLIKNLLFASNHLYTVMTNCDAPYSNQFLIPEPFPEYGGVELYYSAIEAYFTYCNLVTPLFTKQSYFHFKRSRLLNLLIYTTGVQRLKLDPTELTWLDIAYNEITFLSKGVLFRPGLDTAQVMSVALNYCTKIFPVQQASMITTSNMVTMLGLHHQDPIHFKSKWSEELHQERVMAGVSIMETMVKQSNVDIDNFKTYPYHIPFDDLIDFHLDTTQSFRFLSNLNENYLDSNRMELDSLMLINLAYSIDIALHKSLLQVHFAITTKRSTCGELNLQLNNYRTILKQHYFKLLRLAYLYQLKSTNSNCKDTGTTNWFEYTIQLLNLQLFFTLNKINNLQLHLTNQPNLLPNSHPVRSRNNSSLPKEPNLSIDRSIDTTIRIINIYCGLEEKFQVHSRSLYYLINSLNMLKLFGKVNPDLHHLNLVLQKGVHTLAGLLNNPVAAQVVQLFLAFF